MKQKIIVISGEKQSGKTSLCNYLHGLILKGVGTIREFSVDEDGSLLTNAAFKDEEGKIVEAMGELDVFRKDFDYSQWASKKVWPYIKGYNFADNLKEFLIAVFGLTPEQCYGTDDQKNTETQIKWSDLKFALPPRTVGELKKEDRLEEYLTARELMQQFGTNICRRISNNCWVDSCFEQVFLDNSAISVICDARFVNEVERSKQHGAKVIRLTKSVSNDKHESERDLDNYTDWDLVINNDEMSIDEKNREMFNALIRWGWIEAEVVNEEVAQSV